MTSPVDEFSQVALPAAEAAAASDEPTDFGPDEERLVEQARSEALLRLARAL